MHNLEKAVLRFDNGKILKGYIRNFASDAEMVTVEDAETGEISAIDIHQLKAIFFVRYFKGDRFYREKKSYGISKLKGQRIYIKFKDKEDMVGFLEGRFPWEKGFFLSKKEDSVKGFFILPVDEDSNNIKVFVVSSSVIDVTVIP